MELLMIWISPCIIHCRLVQASVSEIDCEKGFASHYERGQKALLTPNLFIFTFCFGHITACPTTPRMRRPTQSFNCWVLGGSSSLALLAGVGSTVWVWEAVRGALHRGSSCLVAAHRTVRVRALRIAPTIFAVHDVRHTIGHYAQARLLVYSSGAVTVRVLCQCHLCKLYSQCDRKKPIMEQRGNSHALVTAEVHLNAVVRQKFSHY